MITDRRLWLVAGLLALVVVLTRWTFPSGMVFGWVVHGGYWAMFALVVLFLGLLFTELRSRWKKPAHFEIGVMAGCVACVALWHAHEPRGFKILADEVLLLGTSMGMHFEREAAYPIRMTDVQGPVQILQSVLDKRPLLFPFLTSVVHDLTGYRPDNAFFLNSGLSVLFLWLMYLIGVRATGERWAGVAGVLLFAGLPLMALQSAGGGFDLLNVLLLAACAWLMADYLATPGERRLSVLVYAALLLASARYESVLFLFPVAVVVLCGWKAVGRVILPWPVILSPLFLAPVLMQNRIFSGSSSAWEMASRPGTEAPFGLEYLPKNLGHALAFFFDFSGYQPASAAFAVLGLLATPFFVMWIVRMLRDGNSSPESRAFALAGVGLLALTGVCMIYFWGQFDHPVIRRLSLPTHLLMALSILAIGGTLVKSSRWWRVLCGVLVGALVLQGIPFMAKRAYAKDYTPGVEMEWRRDFIDRHPERDYLFVDRDSIFWITELVVATPVAQAQFRKEGLAYHLRNHSFSAMYVFQRYKIDDKTGGMTLYPEDDVGAGFELETVEERRIATLLIGRISRITAINPSERTGVVREGFITPSTAPAMSQEEREKARAAYLENWIKQLP